MTIQDALERAKVLQKERQARGRTSSAEEEVRAISPDAGADSAQKVVRPKNAYQPGRAQTGPVAFKQISYDVEVCRENRIFVPELSGTLSPAASAAYRMVRTRVLQRVRANGWSSLAITSPGPGEGKSVTAINLAFTIASEKNSSVFLLDLDMRNPSVCKYLGLQPEKEITEFFTDRNTPPESLFFTVGNDGLILAGGTVSTNQSSELLANGRLDEILAYIHSIAPQPLIILDLPPVLATDDALVAAPNVDSFLLVVGERRTRRDSLVKAVELLSDFVVAGIALNCAEESVGDGYGYYES